MTIAMTPSDVSILLLVVPPAGQEHPAHEHEPLPGHAEQQPLRPGAPGVQQLAQPALDHGLQVQVASGGQMSPTPTTDSSFAHDITNVLKHKSPILWTKCASARQLRKKKKVT